MSQTALPWSFELFFTPIEQQRFTEYSKEVEDHSLVTKISQPFWIFLAKFVPTNVAPNVLNLASLLCLLQASYLCFMYMDDYPSSITLVSCLLLLSYHTLDGVSGKHAKNIANSSPLGEIFQYSCTSVGVVFTSLTISYVYGVEDLSTRWFLVQIAQLVCLRKHVSAFKKGYIQTSILGGEGEILWFIILTLLMRAVFGLQPFHYIASIVYQFDPNPISTVYYILFIYTSFQVFTLPFASRNGIILSLIYRVIPAVLIYLNLYSPERTLVDIVCDGLFMSMLTTDLIVAKMAERDVHPWVVIFAMGSLFSNFVSLFIVFFYYIAILTEISCFMNLPMFTTVRNVYVDGIYDLCHLGHKLAFKNALTFGTRLFVGVINDEDAMQYKRKPIMTTKEREDAVAACKYVHRVIPNAPCFGVTREFLEKYNIHVVACSEEYDSADDIYYKIPRQMGIVKILPRTKGMSTSELIRRIADYSRSLDEEAALKEKKKFEFDQKYKH